MAKEEYYVFHFLACNNVCVEGEDANILIPSNQRKRPGANAYHQLSHSPIKYQRSIRFRLHVYSWGLKNILFQVSDNVILIIDNVFYHITN